MYCHLMCRLTELCNLHLQHNRIHSIGGLIAALPLYHIKYNVTPCRQGTLGVKEAESAKVGPQSSAAGRGSRDSPFGEPAAARPQLQPAHSCGGLELSDMP